jgi:hypothetical protein
MQTYVRFPETEPGKHPIIVIAGIGISGHLEVIGAFRRTRRSRPYRGSYLRQISLRFFLTSCYVFVDLARPGFCRHCILRMSVLIVLDCCDCASRPVLSTQFDPFWANSRLLESFCAVLLRIATGRAVRPDSGGHADQARTLGDCGPRRQGWSTFGPCPTGSMRRSTAG